MKSIIHEIRDLENAFCCIISGKNIADQEFNNNFLPIVQELNTLSDRMVTTTPEYRVLVKAIQDCRNLAFNEIDAEELTASSLFALTETVTKLDAIYAGARERLNYYREVEFYNKVDAYVAKFDEVVSSDRSLAYKLDKLKEHFNSMGDLAEDVVRDMDLKPEEYDAELSPYEMIARSILRVQYVLDVMNNDELTRAPQMVQDGVLDQFSHVGDNEKWAPLAEYRQKRMTDVRGGLEALLKHEAALGPR